MADTRSRGIRNVKTPSRANPDIRTTSLRSDARLSQIPSTLKWADRKRSLIGSQQKFKDPPVTDTLLDMMTDLDVAIENKSDNVLKIVEKVLGQVKDKEAELSAATDVIPSVQLVLLLRWKNNNVVATVAHIFAEIAKCPEGRERLTNLQPPIAQQLVNLLQQKSSDMMAESEGDSNMSGSLSVVIQVCRALGNISYDYDRGQKSVLDAGGLHVLITVLEKTLQLADGNKKKVDRESLLTLRRVATGFLLNMIYRSDKTTCMSQLLPILTRILELDGLSTEGEVLTEHILVILGVLLDGGDHVMEERLNKILVRILSVTTSIDVSGTILELLHRHTDSDIAKLQLARAGLCKILVHMLENESLSSVDEDGKQIIKMACELIVLVLNGDESMPLLYNKGQGQLYLSMKQWLQSEDENKMVTGVLAIGNFARSDSHTLKIVEDQVGDVLLEILKKHNNPANEEMRLQHTLLSAVRNLAIPEANKKYFIEKGVFKVILPLLPTPTLPVMFKLLGTIRTLIDGQTESAKELGANVTVVRRIVECCNNEYHSGVKGEANRLVAWLIKHSRSDQVCRTMLECGAMPHLVNMLGTEHAVMRNEALLALTTVCATNMLRAEAPLADAKIAAVTVKMIKEYGLTTPKPIICNLMTLLGELVTSELLCKKLYSAGINKALNNLVKHREDLEDLKSVVSKLSAVVERC